MSAAGYESIRKYEEHHKKLGAQEVGANAERSCTDTPCVVAFGAIWTVMLIVAIVAIANGDLTRLTSGTDYLGNVCGHGTPKDVSSAVSATWADRKSVFFPITFSMSSGYSVEEALKFPICVAECSEPGDVSSYAAAGSPYPSNWKLNFRTKERFGRCLPDFGAINCTESTTTEAARKDCEKNRDGAAASFARGIGLESTAMRSFAEVRERWWIVVVCAIIAVAIAFVWLFVLRRLVKPVVVVTLVLVLILLMSLGGAFFYRYRQVKDNEESSSRHWYLAWAIGCWIAAFLYLCVGAYLWKDIMVACDIIEEASKIPLSIPTIVAVPPVLVLAIIPVAIFSMFMAAEIYTSGKTEAGGSEATMVENRTFVVNATRTFVGDHWRGAAQVFNLFVFLWTFGFIHAIGFMVIAFCGVFWYWSAPGDMKNPSHGVMDGVRLTFANHLGSLAFGSLIVAIIQTIRVIVAALEHRMRDYIDKSDALKFLVCCMNCCLACFERFVQFINKNAYIVQCLTGESFIGGARHALSLLTRNALSVGAVNIVGEFVMLIGKVLITAATVLIGYAILSAAADKGDGAKGGATAGLVVLLVCVGIIAYFIACVFINVFGVCIDTVLLSYCYDLEQNNGADKPYYCPDDLRAHVGRAESRAKETQLKHAEAANLQHRLE